MKSVFEQAQMFTNMWTDFASRMMQSAMVPDPTVAPTEAARQVRGAVLKTMAESTEQFMRSPEFGEMMRQGMDNAIAFRQQLNEFLTRLHHSAQGVARQDVDSLMLAVRHLERRVLDNMERIATRLEDISRRLEAIENTNGNGESAARRKQKPKAQE